MKQRNFIDLTDDEIREIVTDIFAPKKITCIKRSKKWDEITCKIYIEWETTDDDGNKIPELIPDELTLMNPFDYGKDAIQVQFPVNGEDYTKLKQFCFAKGIYGVSIKWLMDNPYVARNMKSAEEIIASRDENNYVEGYVQVHVSTLTDNDLEGFLDIISEELIGSDLLKDINYEVIGVEEGNELIIKVTGDVSGVLETEEEDK